MVYQLEYYMRFRELGVKGRVSFDDYVNNLDTTENLLMNVELLVMGRAAGRSFPQVSIRVLLSRTMQASLSEKLA
jgi:hypothetical protein